MCFFIQQKRRKQTKKYETDEFCESARNAEAAGLRHTTLLRIFQQPLKSSSPVYNSYPPETPREVKRELGGNGAVLSPFV